MNKMVKFLIVGATVVNFASNLNAVGGVPALSKEQKIAKKNLRLSPEELALQKSIQDKIAREKKVEKIAQQKQRKVEKIAQQKQRNALIKKVIGATLVVGAATALATDLYLNNGENTKTYIIEPVKAIISKIAASNVASKIGGWFSSLWSKMPALGTK